MTPLSGHLRRAALGLATVTTLLLSMLVAGAAPADATIGVPVTYDDFSYASAVNKPSENKPQSKLWYTDGSWWGLLVSRTDNGVHIQELLADHTWRDTGTLVDSRLNSTGDALYVAAAASLHVVSRTSTSPPQVTQFSYDSRSRAWTMASGFPITLQTTGGSESATIDQDSTGRLWVTYTRSLAVWVAYSDRNGLNWSEGFRPPVPDTSIASDDISALIAFSGNIGVLWSDQVSDVFRFAIHKDTGDPRTGWTVENALAGAHLADDHMNLKQLTGDAQGRVFAAIKTSADATGDPNAMLVGVLVRTPQQGGSGTWSVAPAGTVADDHTRPVIMIDQTNQELYFFATAPVQGGDIFYKKTPLDNVSFGPGRGTPFVDYSKPVNNASGSKDPVTAQTGLVILAVAEGVKRYVHAEMELAGGGTPAPDVTPPSVPAGLTATAGPGKVDLAWRPSSDDRGVTGYTLRRGDGVIRDITATSFTDVDVKAGITYTYTVEAYDAAGNRSARSSPATATVPSQPSSGSISLRGVNAAANNAEATLTIAVPAAAAGDLLLASVDSRGTPTITAPPGWQLVREDVNGTALRKATYWRIATAAEPAAYTWSFSGKPAAVGVMLAYSGVASANPIDASSGRASTSTIVTAASVQTTTPNTQLVGLFGVARAASVSPPTGMQEQTEVSSPPALRYPATTEAADAPAATAGPTGDKNATSTVKGPNIGQLVSLRPAP